MCGVALVPPMTQRYRELLTVYMELHRCNRVFNEVPCLIYHVGFCIIHGDFLEEQGSILVYYLSAAECRPIFLCPLTYQYVQLNDHDQPFFPCTWKWLSLSLAGCGPEEERLPLQ